MEIKTCTVISKKAISKENIKLEIKEIETKKEEMTHGFKEENIIKFCKEYNLDRETIIIKKDIKMRKQYGYSDDYLMPLPLKINGFTVSPTQIIGIM